MARERCARNEKAARQAVDTTLLDPAAVIARSSAEIAEGLARARNGESRYTKLLMNFAREAEERSREEKRMKKRSFALEWANEPEWTGEQGTVGQPF